MQPREQARGGGAEGLQVPQSKTLWQELRQHQPRDRRSDEQSGNRIQPELREAGKARGQQRGKAAHRGSRWMTYRTPSFVIPTAVLLSLDLMANGLFHWLELRSWSVFAGYLFPFSCFAHSE